MQAVAANGVWDVGARGRASAGGASRPGEEGGVFRVPIVIGTTFLFWTIFETDYD